MMRISHTCHSRSPVTHPKTPVDSTPRPITAAAPRKRAPTLYYKSHPSYSSYYWPLPTKPLLSRFLHGLGFYSASPKLCGQTAEQGGCPRSCGRPLCSSTSPPSAARRPATTSISPWARVVFQPQLLRQLVITNNESTLVRKTPIKKNDTCPVRPHQACRRLACKKNYMKGRRALPTAHALTGQKHRASGCLNYYLKAPTYLKALKASPSLRT